MIYNYFGFQTLFFTAPQTSNMYGRIYVILIHIALLQHELMLVKIQIAQIVGGGGAEKN
jgi:hypothetical protein